MRILRPFLGPRIIKTGLAAFLVLAIFHWLGSEYGPFAAVAAILAVQPSVSRARELFVQQLLANLLGGLAGAMVGLWFGTSPLAVALSAILVLGLCSRFGLTEAASSAVVALLFIMDRPEHDFILYTSARIGAIVGGMLIGFGVNRYVWRPDFRSRLREDLAGASRGIELFGTHLLASLAAPEHYRKEQIKADAAMVTKRLETARYFLDLYHEANPTRADNLPLEKARASLYVFVERFMDMHKLILQAGGLQPGPELGAVAGALRAVLAYKQDVMQVTLDGGTVDMAAAHAVAQSLDELKEMVDRLVADPERRERGLVLHGVLTNLRHMGWRMDSLTRLLQPEPGK